MKFKFKKIEHRLNKGDVFIEYGVERESLDDSIKSLYHITWHGWTLDEIQMIIDTVNTLTGEGVYDYQVAGSDLLIHIDTDYAYFFDWRTENETEDFSWTRLEFIQFMKDFKIFIEENS